jgi:hypothetical protein
MSARARGPRAQEPSATPGRPAPRLDSATRIADLERELAESLAREAATSEVLRVIASSPTDLQAMLDAVGERRSPL